MRKRWLLPLMVLGAVVGMAVFLYAGSQPQYAWLVFGPEGKLRVQVCMEGEAISLQQFVSGKATGEKNSFKHRSECSNFTIADPDGKTSYVITAMSGKVAKPGVPTELFVNVDVKGPLEYRQYCDVVEMKSDPEWAPLAHFHGPLAAGPATINWKLPPKLALQRGDKPTDLPALVGTMDAEKSCWVVVRSHGDNNQPAFPKGVYPYVEVEFPSKQAGAPAIRKRYPLDHFC
jgi:hypothetical protein